MIPRIASVALKLLVAVALVLAGLAPGAAAMAAENGALANASVSGGTHLGADEIGPETASGSTLAAKGAGRAINLQLFGGRGSGRAAKEIIERKALGADRARSRHIIERIDGRANSVTHQVERNGHIIHQHQTHLGKYGTERAFPNEWIEYPWIP